ncbi:MAG: hypothetical protein WCL27_14285 [Betaproteobacteria bacterium]
MKTAISLYRNRIAPLFDVAESFLIHNPTQTDDSKIILSMPKVCVAEKCLRLHEHGVSVLLCGALSGVWLKHLTELGIEVHSFLTGDAHEVSQIFLRDGNPGLARYAMPGCGNGSCGQRRRQRRRLFCDFDSHFKE